LYELPLSGDRPLFRVTKLSESAANSYKHISLIQYLVGVFRPENSCVSHTQIVAPADSYFGLSSSCNRYSGRSCEK
ncbi:MAG: hypothetical protein R3361_06970, partial [Aequorivita vladivostokensis]|nr:hypothetical protein [Aequorivita vladivostokensis]